MSAHPDPLPSLRAKLDELETIVRRRFEPKVAAHAHMWTEGGPVRAPAEDSIATLQGVDPRQTGTFMNLLARFFGGRR
jgi:hypothetical protein